MPSTEKLPSGKYRGIYRDPAGRKQRVSGTFGRKSDAREAAEDAEVKARRQAAVKAGQGSPRMTFAEWWETVQHQRQFESTDTARVERGAVTKHVLPAWGDIPLNRINRKAVQRWVSNDLATTNLSPGYIRRIYGAFSALISAAVEDEVLSASPCTHIKLPRNPKRPKPYISEDEAARLRAEVSGAHRRLLDFGLETGLRPGELCGLHVHNLDLDRGWAIVADVYVARQKIMRPHPKDDDVRAVPLTAKAVEVARACLEGRDLSGGCGVPHFGGIDCDSALVFRNRRREPMRPENITRTLTIAAERAGLPNRSAYAIRRGFATRAAHGGIDAFSLADILGHANLSETRGYVQQTQTARDRLTAALGQAQSAPNLVAIDGGRGTAWDENHGTAWDKHGTNLDNQGLREVPTAGPKNGA